MEVKPWRSWAKTYAQGWNVALCENTYSAVGMGKPPKEGMIASTVAKHHDWRDECCWKYNRN